MKNKLIIIAVLCFLFPIYVSADCDANEIKKLKKIANNVDIGYEYYQNDSIPLFKMTVTNLNSEIYIHDYENEANYYYTNNNEFTFIQYYSGVTANYNIYSNKTNCKDIYLASINVKIPQYNYYSTMLECKEYPEYKLCKKWGVKTNYNEFYNGLEKYKGLLNNNKEEKYQTNLSRFIDLLFQYYYITLIVIIVFGTLGIIFLKKRKKEWW